MRVSSKGQITIPVSIRKRLGISDGSMVVLEEETCGIVLKKVEVKVEVVEE